MTALRVRAAERGDLPALVRIYNHYVAETPVTFDTREFAVEGRLPWFESFEARGPHRLLVAEAEGQPVGYASSGRFRAKPAYDPTLETTIYLAADRVGRGVGTRLYGALLEILEAELGAHRACAGITLPNPASVALHEKLDFRPVGIFHEVGFKLGRYWDVGWYERGL